MRNRSVVIGCKLSVLGISVGVEGTSAIYSLRRAIGLRSSQGTKGSSGVMVSSVMVRLFLANRK